MESDLVYDVGVNNGDDTAYFLRNGYRVVGIEANPEFVPELEARFASEIRDGRCQILNFAIGPKQGSVTLFVSHGNRGVWSSLENDKASREGTDTFAIEVECRRFSDVLNEYGVPFYLKVDIEGADHYCLADIDPLDAPAYVSFEASEGSIADLFLLTRSGYDSFKLIDQMDGFRRVCPPPLHSLALAREIGTKALREATKRVPALDSAIQWLQGLGGPTQLPDSIGVANEEFSVSSSGPMAEDTDGDWTSLEEVSYAWLYYVRRPGRSNWHDLHARHKTFKAAE